MALPPGTRFGPYEITTPIGVGGMGEVYRARDARLRRDVAIKVLPEDFRRDPARLTRFDHEARALAALNHPNIAAIYGIEQGPDAAQALILELVEGDTLATRIERGPIPVDEAVNFARQIAGALIAAHEKGIVHRDLKPANIAITSGGRVKVLDFGLAKLAAPRESAIDDTRTADATRVGIVVGTAAYMSPEQARGQAVDARSDLWAFGCVLYEMLAGRASFARTTMSDTIAAVIEREPDWHLLPSATPGSVRRLLRRCLQKDPSRRLADVRDAQLELDDDPGDEALRAVPSDRRGGRIAWIGALLIAAGTAALLVARAWPTATPETRKVRFDIQSPPTRDATSIAISPDARHIVFAASSDDRTMLWLHSLEAGSTRPLPGTDQGRYPFWSPDNRSVGFFAEGKLKRIDIESGTVIPLADAPGVGGGGAWHTDGTIFFVPVAGPLLRLSTDGSNATAVQSTVGLGPVEFPRLLPGTRRVLFTVRGPSEGIYVADLDGPERRRLAGRNPATATAESLLFIRDRKLFTQRFDPASIELSGTPTQIASDVTSVSVSDDGAIVYRSGAALEPELTWFDRSGKELGRARERGTSPSISHDGRRVAMMRTRSPGEAGQTNPGIWTWDLEPDRFSRIVAAPPVGNTPIWSWDDTQVVFSSARGDKPGDKPFALYQKRADGAGADELLLQTDQAVFGNDWSRDGALIYRSSDPKAGFDLWTLSRKDGRRQPLVATQFDEREAQFSPDGRWFAYQSNASGQFEIYLAPFPDDGRERSGPVSVDGGTQVRWNSNGNELFYLSKDNRLMSVRIDTTGQLIKTGRPVPLFQTHILDAGVLGQQYVVSREGQRFLIVTTQQATTPITVILN